MIECIHCGASVKDFHDDSVWRDKDGHITCHGAPITVGALFHEGSKNGRDRQG